jgi:ATP-binding cassette subfamily B protein
VFIALQAALHGHGNAGQVMLTVTLGAQLLGSVSGQVSLGQWLQGSLRAVGYYLWLADSTAAASRPSGPAVLPVPDQAGSGLVVDNVSFSYPGTQAPVLREVSLRIPAGSTVAIVGDNGAGKTTLIKLLCRMYEPTAGAITFGGRDIAALDPEAWRGHIAAGFQDFCRFELTVRAAVGVGDLPRATDDAAVSAALHRAGAESLPAELPAGLDTQLGASYPGGVDLSTGQWQKIAVARAMMRDTPALLILDEPTASLDAATEYTLLASYADAIRATGRDMITVLVSHRFSAARLADIIVVLADGQIRETGSHEELTARGGLYDELYRLSQQNLAATASP